jgi:hypothetical protein
MGRFLAGDDWILEGIQMKVDSGFTGVIYRREDAAAIWRWICPHSDHATRAEAIACGRTRLTEGLEVRRDPPP